MHPINKEFITAGELRAQADVLDRTAAKHKASGLLSSAVILVTQGVSKRAHAQRLEEAAADLRDNADFLDAKRVPFAPSTTGNPYGELHA